MWRRNFFVPLVAVAVAVCAMEARAQIRAMRASVPFETEFRVPAGPPHEAYGPHAYGPGPRSTATAFGAVFARPVDAPAAAKVPPMQARVRVDACDSPCWVWQVAPDGIIYRSYLAGGREPRIGAQWVSARGHGWLWDSTLGARIGLIRYGTTDAGWPEGWQLDFEGAAFPRLDLANDRDLVSVDFRFGVPLTFRRGAWEWKFAYYHLGSHLGDEFLERHPDFARLDVVRDTLVLGLARRPAPAWRLYAEVGYAPWAGGGSKPWEFQFGVDYSPVEPTGVRGAPFLALNGRLREEVDFGGNFTMQAGWQWRGATSNLLRFGAHYFNGLSDSYQFFRSWEEHVGLGLWYDF